MKVLERVVLFTNPMPHLRSRHGYFPGVAALPDGTLLALFSMGEAFESADSTTVAARSDDGGKSWVLEGPIRERTTTDLPVSDYMKPTVLADGRVMAMGYQFDRRDPERAIGNPATGGVLPGDVIASFSSDRGKTWTPSRVVPAGYPELIEVSGPCLQLRSGELLAGGALFKRWDGTMPSGQKGVLLRSRDAGRSWSDDGVYFDTPGHVVSPFESRFCEMQDGRIVALVWAYDQAKGVTLGNQVTVSRDGGRSWSAPQQTGIVAQSSSLIWLGGERLLTIHSHRSPPVGLVVRLVDVSDDRWRVVKESSIWTGHGSDDFRSLADLALSVRFGQPSLVPLPDGVILAVHWSIEEGQGMIRTHRLSIDLEGAGW
jgi:sialidase-1